MVAYGTYIGSLLADDDVAAVGTLPDDVTVFREYTLLPDIVQQFTVTFLMGLLNGCHTLELLGYLRSFVVTV